MNPPIKHIRSLDPRPGHTPCRLPPLVDTLAGSQALPGYFGLDDLREMGKFREIPNVHGLAAYPIEHPAPKGLDPWAAMPEAAPSAPTDPKALPGGLGRALAERLADDPLLLIQGMILLPGDRAFDARAFTVRAILPQAHAHLAALLRRALHAWDGRRGRRPCESLVLDEPSVAEPSVADLTILAWPEPLPAGRGQAPIASFIGHWPGQDEPGSPGNPGGPGVGLIVGHDDPALFMTLIHDAARRRSAWPAAGSGMDASAVPPAWAGWLLPAATMAATEAGRARALAVGAWLFGVESDGAGRFPMLDGDIVSNGSVPSGLGWIALPGSS
jgi:hypothetical protein